MDVMQGRPSGPLSTQSPDRHISPKIFEKLVFWKTEKLVFQKTIFVFLKKLVESKSQVMKRKHKAQLFQESRSWTLSA